MVAVGSLTGAPGAGLQRGQWVPASPPFAPGLPLAAPKLHPLRTAQGHPRARGEGEGTQAGLGPWPGTVTNDQTLRCWTSRHRLGSRHLQGGCGDPTSQGAWGKQGSRVLLSPHPAPPSMVWAKGPASPALDRAAPSTWAEGRQSNPNSRQRAELLAPRSGGAPPSSAGNGNTLKAQAPKLSPNPQPGSGPCETPAVGGARATPAASASACPTCPAQPLSSCPGASGGTPCGDPTPASCSHGPGLPWAFPHKLWRRGHEGQAGGHIYPAWPCSGPEPGGQVGGQSSGHSSTSRVCGQPLPSSRSHQGLPEDPWQCRP